jgi:hypothetical protein
MKKGGLHGGDVEDVAAGGADWGDGGVSFATAQGNKLGDMEGKAYRVTS